MSRRDELTGEDLVAYETARAENNAASRRLYRRHRMPKYLHVKCKRGQSAVVERAKIHKRANLAKVQADEEGKRLAAEKLSCMNLNVSPPPLIETAKGDACDICGFFAGRCKCDE